MRKLNGFNLFVTVYMTAFALLMIVLGLLGPMLAIDTHTPGAAVFTTAIGILGVWALMKEVASIGSTIRRASVNAR